MELLKKIVINLIFKNILFNKFAKETDIPDNQVINMRYIDIKINNELISQLFN